MNTKPEKVLVLDIETTGLSSEEDCITCIGVCNDHGIRQFAAQFEMYKSSFAAEEEILREFCTFISTVDSQTHVLTYNGDSFDLPFIKSRLFRHKIQVSNLNAIPSIDLAIYAKSLMGRHTSKDEACRKFANLYVPKKTEGLFTARIYKSGMVTLAEHIEMLQHNAIDLGLTYRFFIEMQRFPDFQMFVNNCLKGEEGD